MVREIRLTGQAICLSSSLRKKCTINSTLSPASLLAPHTKHTQRKDSMLFLQHAGLIRNFCRNLGNIQASNFIFTCKISTPFSFSLLLLSSPSNLEVLNDDHGVMVITYPRHFIRFTETRAKQYRDTKKDSDKFYL